MSILATYREPFGLMPVARKLPDGLTLLQLRQRMHGLPDDFDERGTICINGHPAPRALWDGIRPKPVLTTEITFHAPPMGGGGGDDGKMIVGLVAAIALTVVTGGIAGGWLATTIGGTALFAAGSTSALLLAGAVSLAGGLLLSALIPPPSLQMQSRGDEDTGFTNPGAASAEGNLLQPNAPIPRVIGQRKVFPPLAAEPRTYFQGPDEIVEAVYVLAGPHQLTDIKVGSATIDTISGLEYETREGWPGTPPLTIGLRQSRTEVTQSELRGHLVESGNSRELDTQTSGILAALPQEYVVSTRINPDEHQLQLVFGQGLHRNASSTNKIRVPFRLRARMVGSSTWRNLPELHFQAASLRQLRSTIRLIWTEDLPQSPTSGSGEGWVEARVKSSGQTTEPAQPDWSADPYFIAASGDDYMDAGNLGSTSVKNTNTSRYDVDIYLDPAEWPIGRYEIEIKRGSAFEDQDYNAAQYEVNGVVWDFWGYQGNPPEVVMSRDGLMDTVYFLRSVSLWNDEVLKGRDCAVIAVRARNRELDKVSTVAGGYVRDWDGSGWNDWTITDNPAPHLRDIFVGAENLDPVPLDLIDDAGLVAWRAKNWSCNALLQDITVGEAARVVASCGYARPYAADIWGVVEDYDRSAEDPPQVFTPRNSSNFQWTKAFNRIPEGFRVNFRDKTRDYDNRQITVFRPGHSNPDGRMEQVTYEGIVDEAEAIARAEYDLDQAHLRNTFYSFDTHATQIQRRRGDLIGVQNNVLDRWAASARIESIVYDGSGNVTSIYLDVDAPVDSNGYLDDLVDMSDEDDLSIYNGPAGVRISTSGATNVYPISSADGRRIDFDPAISATSVEDGALVSIGKLGVETRRMIIFEIQPKPDLEAAVTCLDEAPELWSN